MRPTNLTGPVAVWGQIGVTERPAANWGLLKSRVRALGMQTVPARQQGSLVLEGPLVAGARRAVKLQRQRAGAAPPGARSGQPWDGGWEPRRSVCPGSGPGRRGWEEGKLIPQNRLLGT